MKNYFIFGFLLVPFIFFGENLKRDSIQVFFLGGQSNRIGRGQNIELLASFIKKFSNLWSFLRNSIGVDDEPSGLMQRNGCYRNHNAV